MKLLRNNIFGCNGVGVPAATKALPLKYPPTQSFRRHYSFAFVVEYKMHATCRRFFFSLLGSFALFFVLDYSVSLV